MFFPTPLRVRQRVHACIEGESVVGSVTEIGINQVINSDGFEIVNNALIEKIMDDPFPTVSVNACVRDCQSPEKVSGNINNR